MQHACLISWMRRFAATCLVFCVSCGGEDAPDGGRSGSAEAGAMRDGAGAGVAPTDTAPWVGGAARADSLRQDELVAEPAAGETAAAPPAGADPAPTSEARSWTTGLREGGTDEGPMPTLISVRSGSHEEYDRMVFEFDGRVPRYTTEYVDRPQYQCGSGNPVWLPGDGWLEISFTPAQAHDDAGNATVQNRRFDPDGENLREARLICDFEGHVEWIVGMGSPNPYRVMELRQPARLVVDVQR